MNLEKKQRRGLGWDSSKRKGRALSGEHMKGRVCHLGALMTGCVSLFWLKISFNMHDKRRPSGTLPGNSAVSPVQTPAGSARHCFIISASYLTAEHGYLTEHSHLCIFSECAGTCAQKHSSREVSMLKRSAKLFVLAVITPTETAHSSFHVLVWYFGRQTDVKSTKHRKKRQSRSQPHLETHSRKAKTCFQIYCRGKYLEAP